MGFDDSIYKKKTETDAGRAAAQTAIHPVIPVKYPGQIFCRNADPLVRHVEHQPSGSVLILRFLLPAANPDAAGRSGEYLIALLSRFVKTWRRRSSSP